MKPGLLSQQQQPEMQEPAGVTAGVTAGVQQPGSVEQEGLPPPSTPRIKELSNAAITLLYDENFESMVKMFKQHGAQGFPDAMSLAINGTLDRLEKDVGDIGPEEATEIGVALFEAISKDMIEGGVVQEINKELVLASLQKTMERWVSSHQDKIDPQETATAMNGLWQKMQGQQSAPQTGMQEQAGVTAGARA